MKPFSLILTILLPFFGSAVQAQTGMTVFGDWYVSETASIGFFGDELTLQGSRREVGSFRMEGMDTQTIAIHNQTTPGLAFSVTINPKNRLVDNFLIRTCVRSCAKER